ncbi:MAG: hypothetical protein KDA32_14990, partial [Phycisphaerales bacterium]|nr:hypothetical protein [Phycisphaerales bacterium]
MWALLGLALVFGWRGRELGFGVLWSALLLLAWISLTHMPGRFAIPLIAPLTLGIGRGCAIESARGAWRWRALGVAAAVAALVGGMQSAMMFQEETRLWTQAVGVPSALAFAGDIESFVSPEAQPLNALGPDAYVWLVGDATPFYLTIRAHYTVVFSRDPWLEFAASHDANASLNWLRERGVTHVWFAWGEIARLGGTYGFPAIVTREWVGGLVEAGARAVVDAPDGTLLQIAVD